MTFSPDHAAGQFTAAPPTCPGDTFTFRCNVTGNMDGLTIWSVGESSECSLLHSGAYDASCGTESGFTAKSGTGFGTTTATSFTSTLSGTATPELNGTLVECFGPGLDRVTVGNGDLQILGQYPDGQCRQREGGLNRGSLPRATSVRGAPKQCRTHSNRICFISHIPV